MASSEPRPTRYCFFKWKPVSRTLKITLENGTRRRVAWNGLESKIGQVETQGVSKENGPVDSLMGEAQKMEIKGPRVIETQLPLKGSSVIHFKQKDLESVSEGSVGDDDGRESEREGDESERASEAGEKLEMASEVGDGMDEGLQSPSIEPQPVEAFLSMVLHGSSSPMTVGTPPYSGLLEFEPSNLPMMVFGGVDDVVDCSPIVYEPLCKLLPPRSPPQAVEGCSGSGEVDLHQNSKRVDWHMSGFNKFVGFPIDEFEEECLALFQRIEERRNLQKGTILLSQG